MWNITTIGFFTAVRSDEDPDMLVIRGRVRQDMLNVAKYMPNMGKIEFHKERDYPYRALITPEDFGEGMKRLCMETIDYEKFKPAVAAKQGAKREALYTRIWSLLVALEPNPERVWNALAGYPLKRRRKRETKKQEAAHNDRFKQIIGNMNDRGSSTRTEAR